MPKMLNILPEKCTGCMQCELACSWVQTGTFQPSRSAIRVNVFDEEASYAPYTCLQCDEAWCMNVCPDERHCGGRSENRREGGSSKDLCVGLPPVHDFACPFRHRFHAATERQGVKVQPVRR